MLKLFANKLKNKYAASIAILAIALLLVTAIFIKNNQKTNFINNDVGEVLYRALIMSDLPQNVQTEYLTQLIANNSEPEASIAHIKMAEIDYATQKIDSAKKHYIHVRDTYQEEFINSLAKIKLALINGKGDEKNSDNIYYFSTQLVNILNKLENSDKSEIIMAELKNNINSLSESITAPNNIKTLVQKLYKIYF